MITGNTWNFRDDLEKNGFQGTREKEGGQYIRYVRNVDITATEGEQQFLALSVEGQTLSDRTTVALTCVRTIRNRIDIFNKQALRVVVDPAPEDESEVAKFLNQLMGQPCWHFE